MLRPEVSLCWERGEEKRKTKIYLLIAHRQSFPVPYAFKTQDLNFISLRCHGYHWDDLQQNGAESRYRVGKKA
jgi:hypothetical protein